MTHVGEIAAQLTAINSHHAQFGVAWTSTPGDIAQIATNMDKSQSASTKMSSATNPHDRPLNLATSTGVKGWTAGVTLPAHIPTDIKVGPEAKEKFRTLLEHLDVCGFGKILRIATTGTGVAGPSPISHTGSPDSADHQLGDWTSLTTNYVNLTREHILKMSGWIHGDIDDGLTVPTNLVQKTLDFQSTGKNGNSKLVAEMKQQFRIKADQLMHIWRNHINHTSLEAFLAQKDIYVWEKESDGTTFYCVVIRRLHFGHGSISSFLGLLRQADPFGRYYAIPREIFHLNVRRSILHGRRNLMIVIYHYALRIRSSTCSLHIKLEVLMCI